MALFHSLMLAADDPLSHVVNKAAIKSADGFWLWSGNQGNLVLAGLIMIVVGLWAASKIRTGPKSQGAEAYVTRNRFAHAIEVLCHYLREEVARPLLSDRTEKMMPFLWTIFFFILVSNLLGLIPIADGMHVAEHLTGWHFLETPWVGGTATQNFFVTLTLAVIAGVFFNVAAIMRLGIVDFLKHMTGGLPLYMAPIAMLLFLIEAAGQFIIKPFALALRLFANMTAGHVLLAAMLGFGGGALKTVMEGKPTSLVEFGIWSLAAMAVLFLELFVAFLQAFVFMFLTTIFISLMDHHDEHGHEHEHDHAKGHEHAHA
jgi:F-type H+-transporting ATPase subunit a